MSAIIATALVQRKHFSRDGKYDNLLESFDGKLDLPPNILSNLEEDLLPYLKAIQVNGYESKKHRRVFVIGNTGKELSIFPHSNSQA